MILPAAAWEPMLRLGPDPRSVYRRHLLSEGCSGLYAVGGISLRTSARDSPQGAVIDYIELR